MNNLLTSYLKSFSFCQISLIVKEMWVKIQPIKSIPAVECIHIVEYI